MTAIFVKHNMQVAHRLLNLPGKCQQIHGHSMEIHLYVHTEVSSEGYALAANGRDVLDFGDIKKRFRQYIDTTYDHHLLLNEADPWASKWYSTDDLRRPQTLPGLVTLPGDPSVENLAKWICKWASEEFKAPCKVVLHETSTNGVEVVYP